MDPISALAAATAAMTIIEKLLPVIQAGVKSGQIPVEQQQTVRANYDRLKDKTDEMFSGPEWAVE